MYNKKGGVIIMEKLKIARKNCNITQNELAKKIGKGRTTITEYENGKIDPPGKIILEICKELNVSADWLLDIKKESE